MNLWKGSLIRPTGRLCKVVPKTNWPSASKTLPRNAPWVAEDLFLFCWWFQNESRIVSTEQYIYPVYLAVVESWLYRKKKDQIMLMLQVWMVGWGCQGCCLMCLKHWSFSRWKTDLVAIQGLGPYLFKFEDQKSTPPKNLRALIGRCISREKKTWWFYSDLHVSLLGKTSPLDILLFLPAAKIRNTDQSAASILRS